MNIHQRIRQVMTDVAYVQKEDKKVNKQYTFVSHDAVTKAVRGAMIEHGIVAIPNVTAWHQDGNRTSVDLMVEFFNVEDPKDSIQVNVFGFGVDPQDKGPGKAFSYAKKYAFLLVFCLETGDDPERDSIDHEPKPWKGPIKKTALKSTLREIGHEIHSQTNIEDLKLLVKGEDNALALEQAEEDLPDYYKSVREEYKKRLSELQQLNPPE